MAADNFAARRLRELRTRLALAQGFPELAGLLPDNVLGSVDLLLQAPISRDAVSWFLSEMHMALGQRLSGIELGALLGRTGGVLERQGGTQRLLLASDNLLYRVYYLLLARSSLFRRSGPREKAPRLPRPMLLSVFDYPTAGYVITPPDVLRIGVVDNAPLFVHISTNKYAPWLFIAGIKSICQHVQDTLDMKLAERGEGPDAVLRTQLRHAYAAEHCLATMSQFLEPELLIRLLLDSDDMVFRDAEGAILVERDRFLAIAESAIAGRDDVAIWWRGDIGADASLEPSEAARVAIAAATVRLTQGELFSDLASDTAFVAFLNGFLHLCLLGKATARAYMSFIFSLCSLGLVGGGAAHGQQAAQ